MLNNVYETLSIGMLRKVREHLGVTRRITYCSYDGSWVDLDKVASRSFTVSSQPLGCGYSSLMWG